MGAKMDYLSTRQGVISQNIANADTPGYRPRDLKPVDFGAVIKRTEAGAGGGTLRMAATNPGHRAAPGVTANAKSEKQRETYEVAPVGNAVVMEEQLVKSNETLMDYNLVTSLYQKNVRLLQIAMGV